MEKSETIRAAIDNSAKNIRIFPVKEETYGLIKEDFKLNPESTLGTVVLSFGGIVIDNWIRIYGCGELDFYKRNTSFNLNEILVAEDILGGLFSCRNDGSISYFAPDTLEWESLDINYSRFISWCIDGDTDTFYRDFRWSGCRKEAENIPIEKGMSFYPFLWAAAESMDERSRKVISMDEIIKLELGASAE